MMKATPSVDTAVRYLQDLLARKGLEPSARLPAIGELALGAGVSLVTMWRAVRRLAQKGVLVARPGVGIHRASANKVDNKDYLAQTISRRLLQDILEGRFHTRPALPSIKELASVYHVGSPILRTAVSRLAGEGYIARRNRALVPLRFGNSFAPTSSIHLITGPGLLAKIEISHFRSDAEFFARYFEQQCARQHIRVITEEVEGTIMGALGAARDALGCLIWVTESLLPLMPSIMDHLLKLKKRVVMFHHREEDPRVTPIDCAGGAVCQMAIDNVGAGVAIGKRLLELGHRSICYLSYKREGWPAERYEGLARAFTDAGYPDGVRWISEGDPQTLSLMQRKPRISRESSRALADNRMFEDLRTTVVNSMIAQPYRGRTVRRLEEMAFCRVLYKGMEPALRLALTQTNVTAWVATEDYAALHAILPFLRSHRVRVPRDLSVVSINDQFESLLSGLTSYHFDMTSVAMRALTFLLSPASDRRLRPNAPALEPVGGFIIDRGSAGKPNRRSLN